MRQKRNGYKIYAIEQINTTRPAAGRRATGLGAERARREDRVAPMSTFSEVRSGASHSASDAGRGPAGLAFSTRCRRSRCGAAALAGPAVLLLSLILAAGLIALSEIDRKSFRLPDAITIPLLLAGLVAAAIIGRGRLWHASPPARTGGDPAGGPGLSRLARACSGIGIGDAKLFAASGAWLGAEALPTVLLWACVLALLRAAAGARPRAGGSPARRPFRSDRFWPSAPGWSGASEPAAIRRGTS